MIASAFDDMLTPTNLFLSLSATSTCLAPTLLTYSPYG